jgi:hypothetical protein
MGGEENVKDGESKPVVPAKPIPKAKRDPVTLVFVVSSLLTSIAAFNREQPEKVAEAGYKTLSKAVEQLAEDSQKNHDDVVALRLALEDYMGMKEGPDSVTSEPDQNPDKPAAAPSVTVMVTPSKTLRSTRKPEQLDAGAPEPVEPPAPPEPVVLPAIEQAQASPQLPTLEKLSK